MSVKACWALAHALSACADSATGRNALPGTDALTAKPSELDLDDPVLLARLQTATGYGKTSLQKAARVLAERGWIVLVRSGKNWLTPEDRQELRRAGSAARQRRNVWACTTPVRLRSRVSETPAKHASPSASVSPPSADQGAPVDNLLGDAGQAKAGCDLPTTRRVGGSSLVPEWKIFKPEQASRTAPSGRAPTRAAPRRRRYRADLRTVRLAKDLRSRIYWLRAVPHQRIMPSLDRFARAGWTAADVQRALDAVLASRGWEVPTSRPTVSKAGKQQSYPLRSPWGYLAMLLRCLEPTDLDVEREHARAVRQAEIAHQELLRNGPECPHGQPGGQIPSPVRAIIACALCRRGAR